MENFSKRLKIVLKMHEGHQLNDVILKNRLKNNFII